MAMKNERTLKLTNEINERLSTQKNIKIQNENYLYTRQNKVNDVEVELVIKLIME